MWYIFKTTNTVVGKGQYNTVTEDTRFRILKVRNGYLCPLGKIPF